MAENNKNNQKQINIELDEHTFQVNRERAIDYLNTRERLFVIDAFAGWDPKYRLKVRIICTRAYHALFMQNMLIMPSAEELADFGTPDYVIYNGGSFPANRFTTKMTSKTSIDVSLEQKEIVFFEGLPRRKFDCLSHSSRKRAIFSVTPNKKGKLFLFFSSLSL